ncbi:MAG: hypothetical protein WCS74_01370 [Dehalococcoidales bacterium]
MDTSGGNAIDVMERGISMWFKVSAGNLGEKFVTVFQRLDSDNLRLAIEMLIRDGWDTVQVEKADSIDVRDICSAGEALGLQ